MQILRKLTWFINTALLGFVLIMTGFYAHFSVTYMVYHSIPTIALYLALYYLIYRDRLDLYVWAVYAVITVYMIAATICLGYNFGFHLYCTSLIPLSFYMEYLAHKLHTKKVNALLVSFALVCAYLASTNYTVAHGPVYEIDRRITFVFLNVNAVSVFCFLIGYTHLLHKLVLDSETKLSDMAHTDQLTGLNNRHYMTACLEQLAQNLTPDRWMALADIDDFKRINDRFGHNCGDYVLITLSQIMRDVCGQCVIARWGGEEFLIVPQDEGVDIAVLEALRQAVENRRFSYDGQDVPVTITIGVARYQEGLPLDRWIQAADDRLYQGKNEGKNRLVL